MSFLRTLILLLASCMLADASDLAPAEIQQMEEDLGIILSAAQKADLAAILKPDNRPDWRVAAEDRIADNRMAELNLQVVDKDGNPLPGATVSAVQLNNDFHFGGVLNLKDFTDERNDLDIPIDRYRELFLKLFNAGGLDNGFKPKQRSGNEHLLPGFINWAQSNDLPIRGHNLIWPGTPSNNHLPADILADVEAVEQAIAGNASQETIDSLKATLKTNVDAMIAEWASLWDVYEWDVINETLSNYRVQELIGYDQMAEWFKIARANAVQPDCELVLNEFQIISARSDDIDYGEYINRAGRFKSRINRILADGGPLTKIGFQSRIKFEHRDPQIIYDRLEDFAQTYGLPMVGTEFEVRDNVGTNYFPYEYTEFERAQITEEMLTQYYSHPLVTGLFVWTYMKPELYALCYMDGTIKLNGLVWYYLHRIRYTTREEGVTDASGDFSFPGHKGQYEVTVRIADQSYQAQVVLDEDKNLTITLEDPYNGESWGMYSVGEDNYVNTSDWLGWLQVEHAPLVWSHQFGSWLLVPHASASDGQGWIFLLRPSNT